MYALYLVISLNTPFAAVAIFKLIRKSKSKKRHDKVWLEYNTAKENIIKTANEKLDQLKTMRIQEANDVKIDGLVDVK